MDRWDADGGEEPQSREPVGDRGAQVSPRYRDDSEELRSDITDTPERRSPGRAAGPRRMRRMDPRRRNQLVLVAVIVVLALIFIAQNRERVNVQYLSVDISSPMWIVVVGYFVLGAAIAGVAVWLSMKPPR
jgi:uncharacterized integral membrane protein